ncbi:hypothetical protein [Streptomyces cacaoi]|uniref:hypothetical protein n=1 Tax=Streptomyces cacaoi TaxID=1898 RepID=UPI0011F36AA1|nr:hypothetical protein [Streptomyces cacaoi]
MSPSSLTVKATAATTPTQPGSWPLVTIAEEPADALSSWRRLVTGTDPSARPGARTLVGQWLDPGCIYALPVGGVVVTCDRYSGQWHLTMCTVTDDGLTTVKEWRQKSPMGARAASYVARRLPDTAADMRAVAVQAKSRTNLYDGRCYHCRRWVDAGAGRLIDSGGRKEPAHLSGQCPPPPQVVTPNRRGEPCQLCGNWVERGTGVALRQSEPDPATGSYYRAAHQTEPGACPLGALPGPRNRVNGWCSLCGELVAAGGGYWDPTAHRSLRHAGDCPAPKWSGPTWQVRRARHEPAFKIGQVRRVRVDLRRGGDPVPPQTLGYRVLSETYIELIGLVVEVVEIGRRQWARLCPATASEAADMVADDTVAALDARPDAGAVMAGWSVEKIGHQNPWLAEITGRHPDYEYRREFLLSKRDYTNANSRGTRGVQFHWDLLPNRVYEAAWSVSHRETRREFLKTTPDGDVETISREEVEAWLNHAATWAAS